MSSQGPESGEVGFRIRGRLLAVGLRWAVSSSMGDGEREESKVMEFTRVPRTEVQLVAEVQALVVVSSFTQTLLSDSISATPFSSLSFSSSSSSSSLLRFQSCDLYLLREVKRTNFLFYYLYIYIYIYTLLCDSKFFETHVCRCLLL